MPTKMDSAYHVTKNVALVPEEASTNVPDVAVDSTSG